jgi:capsular polysaccharide biosynthesis protein
MELELKDIFRIIRKRLWILIIFVLLTTLIAGIYSYYLATPIYQASTKLIVNKTSETLNLGQQLTLSDVNLNISLINTYKEIIRTTYVMNIVAELNPEFNLTAAQLISKVKVNSVNQTQVMTVSVEDESHAKAVKIVNQIAEVFKDEVPNIIKVDNVSILDQAKNTANPIPIRPQPLLNIAIGFILGLMLAIGLILILEYLDDTLKTEEDISQYLQLPTLAMITSFDQADSQKKSRKSSKKSKFVIDQGG